MAIRWNRIPFISAERADVERSSGQSMGLITALWFGLLAGWLELGFVHVQQIVFPRVLPEMIRTNRHFVWMVPVSTVLIFLAAGVAVRLVAKWRAEVGRWVEIRLLIAMVVLTLALNIEGLYSIAVLILACGVASVGGSWLDQYSEAFGRLVRVTFLFMAAGFLGLTGVGYERVKSAELRMISQSPPAKPNAPNVLLIVLDTVRASCLSLYGHYRPTTPNLERLARRGIVYTEARATAPWTSPTHGSMMTGRWPHELSVGPETPLDSTFPTVAEVLAGEGYATAGFVGNIYYCNALLGFDRGFARYEDAYENQTVSPFEILWSSGLGRKLIRSLGYSTKLDDGVSLIRKSAAMLNRDVLNWLDKRPSSRPFFAFINYYDAHRPYILNDESAPKFGMAMLPPAEQEVIDRRFQDMATGKPIPAGLSTEQITRDGVNLCHDSYDSCIAYLDLRIGQLLDEIDRRGLLDNTLVIITSDHGEQIGEHGLVSHGASLYREEVHVPLVVIPPRRLSGPTYRQEPVSLRDIPATIAEWVELEPRHPFPGQSLTRFLTRGSEPGLENSPVLSELHHNIAFPATAPIPAPFGPARSLVSRDRVYIRRQDGAEELYDRMNDPLELVNLAGDPRTRLEIEAFRDQMSRIYNVESSTRP